MLHYMKCAEQVRNVYGQVQMWKAIYRYIISTNLSLQHKSGSSKSAELLCEIESIFHPYHVWSVLHANLSG